MPSYVTIIHKIFQIEKLESFYIFNQFKFWKIQNK